MPGVLDPKVAVRFSAPIMLELIVVNERDVFRSHSAARSKPARFFPPKSILWLFPHASFPINNPEFLASPRMTFSQFANALNTL